MISTATSFVVLLEVWIPLHLLRQTHSNLTTVALPTADKCVVASRLQPVFITHSFFTEVSF
jgi:hypothetical protein